MREVHNGLHYELYYQAARNLSELYQPDAAKNVRNSLFWIKNNPEEFRKRVDEFGKTFKWMQLALENPQFIPRYHMNLRSLSEKLEFQDIQVPISPEQLIQNNECTDPEDYEDVPLAVKSSFEKINRCFDYGYFPPEVTDNPSKMASTLLIEGYGIFLEEYYDSPGLADQFALAFFEVLVKRMPKSALLKDVSGHMWDETAFTPYFKVKMRDNKEENI